MSKRQMDSNELKNKKRKTDEEKEIKTRQTKIKSRMLYDLLLYSPLPMELCKMIHSFIHGSFFIISIRRHENTSEFIYFKIDILNWEWTPLWKPFTYLRLFSNFCVNDTNDCIWMLHEPYRQEHPNFYCGDPNKKEAQEITFLTPYPRTRHNYCLVANSERVILVGGISFYKDPGYEHLQYDITKNIWKVSLPSHVQRSKAAGVIWNHYVYIFGGTCGNEAYAEMRRDGERYDIVNNVWEIMAEMPTGRYDACAVIADEVDPSIYIIGGYDDSMDGCNNILIYSISSNSYLVSEWKLPEPLTVTRDDLRAQMFLGSNQLVISYINQSKFVCCYIRNLCFGEWILLPSVP